MRPYAATAFLFVRWALGTRISATDDLAHAATRLEAALAASPSDTNRALELHRRAGVLPEGIDAVEYQFIESLIEDPARGGVEALAVLAKDDSDEIVRKTAVLALADLAADPVPTDFNCVACQDARRSVVTLPCKHCSLCHACAATIRSSTNACPICRGAIDSTVAFHLA